MRPNISRKIKELNEKLDEITREREREREMYKFQLIGGPTFEEWPITIFLVKESKILGRDKDRVLVSNLLGEDTGSNVP